MLVVTEEISVPLLVPLNKCGEQGKKKRRGGENEGEKENVAAVKA